MRLTYTTPTIPNNASNAPKTLAATTAGAGVARGVGARVGAAEGTPVLMVIENERSVQVERVCCDQQ